MTLFRHPGGITNVQNKVLVLLYNFSIQIYGLLIFLASPFHARARRWREGRTNQPIDFPAKTSCRIWFHVASLGEFEQARPVIESLSERHVDMILTFFSPSGYEAKHDYPVVAGVRYMPLDTQANAYSFLTRMDPDLAVFVRYDLWYHHLRTCIQLNVPILLICARFEGREIYFRWAKRLFIPVFRQMDHVFVQDHRSTEVLKSVGVHQLTLSGNTRVDRVLQIGKSTRQDEVVEAFVGSVPVMIFGSVWFSDLDMVLAMVGEFPQFRIVIAPHQVEQAEITKWQNKLGPAARYSDGLPGNGTFSEKILLMDTIGKLASSYRYANYAYVGGGFRGALHNVLEPAVFGIPVFFGSHDNNRKFPEVGDLEREGVAYSVKTSHELLTKMKNFESSSEHRDQVRKSAEVYFAEQSGATSGIVDYILNKWH